MAGLKPRFQRSVGITTNPEVGLQRRGANNHSKALFAGLYGGCLDGEMAGLKSHIPKKKEIL